MDAAVLRRFGLAFAATGLVVVIATVFRGKDAPRNAAPIDSLPIGSVPLVSSPTGATSAQVAGTSRVAAASGQIPATAVSTTAPEPTDAVDPAVTNLASAGTEQKAPAVRRSLPRPDFKAYCMTAFGSLSSVLIVKPDARGLRCSDPNGGQPSDIDVDVACKASGQRSVRAVYVDDTSDGWRCTTETRIDIGPPESTMHCQRLYGLKAIAVAIGAGGNQWECEALQQGMFVRHSDAFSGGFDPVCVETYGPDVFSANDTGSPNGWRCYEAG